MSMARVQVCHLHFLRKRAEYSKGEGVAMKTHVRARPKFNNIRRSGNQTLRRACSAKQITCHSSRFNGYCLSDFKFKVYVPHVTLYSDVYVLYFLILSLFFTFFLCVKIKNVRNTRTDRYHSQRCRRQL